MSEPTYNPPPPEVVKQLEQSRLFLETSLREGHTVYFDENDPCEGLDLAAAVLTEGMLIEANFSHSRLDDAWVDGAWGGGLRLIGASLTRTRFTKANLTRADFSGASGAWAKF